MSQIPTAMPCPTPEDLAAMFPGRPFIIPTATNPITAVVYSIPFESIRRYSDLISECIGEVASIVGNLGFKPTQGVVISIAVPIVIKRLLPLVASCIEGLDIMAPRLPHWVVPQLVQAWIEESFGDEKKVRPWVTLVEQVVLRTTGQTIGIWDTLLQFFTSRATPAPKSEGGASAPSGSTLPDPLTS